MTATVVEPGTVRMERLLPGPVERVWAYITDGEKRAKWLAGGAFDLRVGGKVHLDFDNDRLPNEKLAQERGGKHAFTGAITRLEPLRLLAHTWLWNDTETELTYELTPRGKDVLLVITHRRLGDLVGRVLAGWDVHTGILEDLLNGTPPRPFWATHDRLAKEYAARAG